VPLQDDYLRLFTVEHRVGIQVTKDYTLVNAFPKFRTDEQSKAKIITATAIRRSKLNICRYRAIIIIFEPPGKDVINR